MNLPDWTDDKGYELSTHEKQQEFAKKRNQSMNERIKQLAEQADIYINESSNLAESGNGTEIVGWHIEKFAELIVKECALQCNHNDDMDRILEYFGVEE